jgi:hypothetical protein
MFDSKNAKNFCCCYFAILLYIKATEKRGEKRMKEKNFKLSVIRIEKKKRQQKKERDLFIFQQ